jgi:ferritin-like metal-binding protein YciE
VTISTMNELFVHGLQDVYYAENQLLKELQEVMTQIAEPALGDLLEHHVGETREQIARLANIQKTGTDATRRNLPGRARLD